MQDFQTSRVHMVDGQVLPNRVTNQTLIAALLDVPREEFVPKNLQAVAYLDEDLEVSPGRYLMEPMVLARLLQEAQIRNDDVVLDVGCAGGYSTAVIARLAGLVVGLEEDEALAALASAAIERLQVDNAVVVQERLAAGYGKQAPYNVILLQGRIDRVPAELLDQLADGGRLLAAVGNDVSAKAVCFTRTGDSIGQRTLFDAQVPPLPGFEKPASFVF